MIPKTSNGHRPSSSTTGAVSQRLARRANGEEDPKRIKLLSEILEETSSPPLNDISSQQLGPRHVAESHSRLLDLLDELRNLEATLNPNMPERTDRTWENFFSWIDSNLANDMSSRIGVSKQSLIDSAELEDGCNIDDDEYSLVAKVPLKMGDKIFGIDRKLMLSTETATQDSDLYEFIKKDSIASGMQNVVLVLHLLNEYSKGEQSYWWPYLSILPRKTLPVFGLNKSILLKYLIASSHIFEALKLLRSIARQYSYFYQRLHSTRLPLRKDFTFEYYAWGVSCVCSRQNEVPNFIASEGSLSRAIPYYNAHALIPVLDMCNHDASSNQAIFSENSSCLIAVKDLQIADEVTINYGCQSRSSGEFYIHNGFVPNASNNNYDVVPLTIGLSKQNVLFEKKAKLLKILNMPNVGRFKLVLNNHENRHKHDPHLTMFLIVYSLTEQELDYILDAPNPVGIADEIYEFVHYKKNDDSAGSKENRLEEMKQRLAKCVEDYLCLRASVSIALIDRTLDAAKKDQGNQDLQAIRLLQCERRIFESYKSTK